MNTRFKFKIGSQTLILVSTLYFTFGLNWALWRYFYDKVSFDNPLFCLALPILLCLPLFLFFNLVIVPKLAKPLLVTFLLLSSATNHLMYNLGVYIDKDMIRNAVETNVREASDFFTLTGFLWVLATGIAPIILLLMTKIEFSPARQELKKRLLSVGAGLALAGVSAALSYKDIVAVGRNHKPARKIINTVNYVYSTFRYVQNLKPRHFTVLEENIPAVRIGVDLCVRSRRIVGRKQHLPARIPVCDCAQGTKKRSDAAVAESAVPRTGVGLCLFETASGGKRIFARLAVSFGFGIYGREIEIL